MANKKISQLTAKGSALAATDLVEISEDAGGGTYVTKSVTGANIKSGLQATLVSGTNIKTVNSTTLLGSGNLAVQPTLVSGTNIKTINSNTLLGSGDLVIGSGSHVLTKPVSGRTYNVRIDSTSVTANTAIVPNFIYLSPFIPANTLTVSAFQLNVTVVGVGNARFLVYSDLNGVPNNKLLESDNQDCSTLGLRTYNPPLNFTFTAGTVYWLGIYSSIACTISSINGAQLIPISTSVFTGAYSVLNVAATFPNAPTTLGTVPLGSAGQNMYAINLTSI
jgi:hypothetical protein